jgi:molecular chaperone GrpE
MPSNGSRHNDDALGRAESGNDEDPGSRARGEGEALAPEREVSDDTGPGHNAGQSSGQHAGPRIRDLRASRGAGASAGTSAGDDGHASEIPNIYEGLSPDLTTGTGPDEQATVLTKERDELLDALRRTQADFENYKKRIERQSAEQRDRANERIVERLLPALDAFSLARSHLGDEETSPENRALLQAAALLEDALTKEGLERIVADGVEFDPSLHEAVEHLAADDDPDQAGPGPTVAGVLRPGYAWKGRVIRPAMVRVRG